MYPEQLVAPMKAELTSQGFTELISSADVDNSLSKEGTTLLMINSVCGCSAGTARPGVLMAVKNAAKVPDRLTTSFAGVDTEAVKHARANYLLPYPPSSPAIALLKDGKLVHMIERHNIEGRSAQMIAANLIQAFDAYCG